MPRVAKNQMAASQTTPKVAESGVKSELMLKQYLAWWMVCGVIFPKQGVATGVPVDGKPLKPNALQKTLQEAINWFRVRGLPVRLIILKPRQKGSSTGVGAVFYHALSSSPEGSIGWIVAGNEEQTRTMVEIMEKYSNNDPFFKDRNPSELSSTGLWGKWANGNKLKTTTLGGKPSMVGGMVRFAWGTECALWDSPADDNVSDAGERWANARMTVPYEPGTMIIEESTARGATGVFYERFMEAEPWEQVKKNDGFSSKANTISLFFPFYAFETSLEIGPNLSPDDDQDFIDTLQDDEREYRNRVQRDVGYTLTGTQMKWRRWAMTNLCNNDPTKFDRDFPYSAKEAFSKSGNPRFSKKGMSILRKRLASAPPPSVGNLTMQGVDPFSRVDRITWDFVHERRNGSIWIYEQPRVGCNYVLICDPCEGKTTTGNRDPDNHGIGVWRQGYRDEHGVWFPIKLVARCATYDDGKLVCRWEPGYAEKELWKLSRYYGGTGMIPIIIEKPIDCGMNRSLKEKGAPLYIQRRPDTIEEVESTSYGFVQTMNTKLDIVGQLAQKIVENFNAEDGGTTDGGGICIEDEWTLSELESFVTKANGRVEAGSGHDDQVIMSALGVACIHAATPHSPPHQRMDKWEMEDVKTVSARQGIGSRRRGDW